MTHEIFMPALSSTMETGKIVSWEKSPGDKVSKGETVLVVESDKADMDVESFYDGYLAAILVEAGGEAPVGAAIALLAETEAEIETVKKQAANAAPAPAAPAPAAPAPATPTAPVPVVAAAPIAPANAPQNGSGRTIASPRARKLAKDYGVNLATLSGSGPYGRIVAADVEAAAGKAPAPTSAPVATPAVATPAATPAAPVAAATDAAAAAQAGQVVPLTTLQKAVVQSMVASLQVPVFRASYGIITNSLDKLYKQIKPKGVTMTALLAKAVAATLQKHPLINANYTEAGVRYPEGINIAVAVAMDDGGLITPVLQNADRADIYSLSRTWRDLVARARSKQLKPEEYSTGTFTISNLGMFGVESFDAILPPNQGSILAVGGSLPTVLATEDGAIAVRNRMMVNITCDHRVIYGAHAAAFLKDLAALIETNAESLTL